MNAEQIQKLVDDAYRNNTNVMIPQGFHVIDKPIRIPSNVKTEGA